MIDKQQIYQWWDVFKHGKELTEVRILDGSKTYSGYFHDVEALINAIMPYDGYYKAQIYFTLNHINEACYSRCPEKIIQIKREPTTGDLDIDGRTHVLIDLDPKRPAGVSASDVELEYAHMKAVDVYRYLMAQGFNEPIICRSGNGYHVVIPCKIAINDETTQVVKKFLQVMSILFSDEHVEVDEKVFNASRICKLYGVTARKGENTAERPWRQSQIVKVPREVKDNDIAYFKKIASLYPEDEIKPSQYNNYSTERFDLVEFLNKHGIGYKTERVAGGVKYILDHCPFNEQHRHKDAVIFQRDNGAIGFVCLHNSCSGKTWKDVRLLYEPDAYNHEQNVYRSFSPYQKPVRQPIELQEESGSKGAVWQTMAEIEDEDRSLIVSIPSGITQYDKECCGFDKPSLTVWSGNNGCVDCDTEYFNGTRWKRISEYTEGDYVLQYNCDGIASLVLPQKYHKYHCDVLTLMTNKTGSINQCLSDEHNIVYITSKGNLQKQYFAEFKTKGGHQCQIIPHFSYSGEGIEWTDEEIELALAVSAEGHLFEHRPNKTHRVRINLKHEYKKRELERLLSLCSVSYEKRKYNPHDLEYDTYLFNWGKSFKVFPVEWYSMNQHQLKVVKDNITIWDGNVKNGRGGVYSTTKKENADFVQFCISSLNHRCSIKIDNRPFRKNAVYILHFARNESNIRCYPKGLMFEDYKTKDGYKYCFTVPSGMLVLRRNGAINITGNSAKSTLLNQLALNAVDRGFIVAIYTGELRGKRFKRWIVQQAAGKAYNRKSTYNDYDYYTPNNIKDKVVSWLGDKLYNYNTKYSHNIEQICAEVRKIVLERKVDMLVMDNLSCLDIEELEGGINEQQKAAIKMLLRLCDELCIALHLVVHPKKSEGFLRKNDVSGAKTLTDLADNVLFVHRWNQDTQNAAKEFLSPRVFDELNDSGATNIVEVIKQREFGEAEGHIYKLYYEPESRRLRNDIADYVHYGWEEHPVEATMNFGGDNDMPFTPIGGDAPF